MVLDLTDAGFADLLTASKPRPVGMISYSDPALIGYMESNTTFEHVDLPNDLHAAKTEPRLVTIRKWAADLAASWDEFTKSSGVMTRSSACFDHADTWIEQNGGPALKFQRTFFDKLPD